MEGNVVWSYLRRKFSSTLKRAEAELSSSSQIISRLRSIDELLDTVSPNSGNMVDPLYELMDALSECTIFAREAGSKKGFNYLFRVVRFENKMKSRLDQIETKLRSGTDHQTHNGGVGLVIEQIPDPSPIRGFESELGEIEKLLMPKRDPVTFKSIGIVGRCGCGKTALARKVISSSRVEKRFFPIVWVGLSDWLSDNDSSHLRERILVHILTEIGHDDSDLENGNLGVAKLMEKLRLRLMGKRYLIVLDGAWRVDEWFADLACTGNPASDSFTRALPKGSGGAVIVTSQGEYVLRGMLGEKQMIRFHLSGDVCWQIFLDAVQKQGRIDIHHPTLMNMKESVIDNCQGLPLAAKTLANVISNLLA